MLRKTLKFIFVFALISFVLLAISAGLLGTWAYHYITRDLPQLSSIEDYKPPAVTKVFDRAENLIAEFYTERRYPVRLSDVPLFVRNCFLAAEDSTFYSHPGIDLISIARASFKNLQSGSSRQGASTITQQVVKNLLLTPQKDIRRKLKEAILSYRLEKVFSKDQILEIYLNQMFFGNSAYGIKAAAKVYFHKELDQITLAEAAMLAGLLKAPSKYSPISNRKQALNRQRYVLTQMLENRFVSKEAVEAALAEEVKVYPANNEKLHSQHYYGDEVRRELIKRLGGELEVDTGGYEVHVASDPIAEEMALKALRVGLRRVDKRRGWRGPLKSTSEQDYEKIYKLLAQRNQKPYQKNVIYLALVEKVEGSLVYINLGLERTAIDLSKSDWAKKKINPADRVSWIRPEQELVTGSLIEVALSDLKANEVLGGPVFELDQTPLIEGALVLIDPSSGEVRAMAGGYDYRRSQFNRVTQSVRQPGSTFKPIVYLAAVDGSGYTPSTIVHDEPRTFRAGDELWTPGNFDEKYLGDITLRVALEKSRNLVSADIISRIGIDAVINYARKLGITSALGRNLSLSLGSSEVSLLELSRAYSVFPAKGVLFDSVFITKILDRNGQIIFDASGELLSRTKQVINENSAFVMTHMLRGVVEHGTAQKVKELARPVAGKTGTSNDQMDAWFIGFTPDWVTGVWVGFDTKKEIGNKETGGKVSAPIFLEFMQDFLAYNDQRKQQALLAENKAESERLGLDTQELEIPALDFSVPEGVDPMWVDHFSGYLAAPGAPGAILDYFIKGTEPEKGDPEEPDVVDYLGSDEM